MVKKGAKKMPTQKAQKRGAEIRNKLSTEQREELLGTLTAHFQKNMNRHKSLEWAKVQGGWKLILQGCGHSARWNGLA
jgi:hypothetical protein